MNVILPGLATRLNSRVAKRSLFPMKKPRRIFPATIGHAFNAPEIRCEAGDYAGNPDAGRAYTGCTDPEVPLFLFRADHSVPVKLMVLCEIARELCGRCFVVHQTGAGNRNDCELLERKSGRRYRSLDLFAGKWRMCSLPRILLSLPEQTRCGMRYCRKTHGTHTP